MARPHYLKDYLEGAHEVLVLLAPGTTAASMGGLGLSETVKYHELAAPVPRSRERDAVLLGVRDLTSLRLAASGLGNVGAARQVGVWFERETTRLPTVTPPPEWPPLEEVVASGRGDHFVVLTFSRPAQARPVLLQIARAASASRSLASGWPVLGAPRNQPSLWPVADPAATVAMPGRLFDASVEFPPDLVLSEQGQEVPPEYAGTKHPLLGRPPVVARVLEDLTWERLSALAPSEVDAELERRGPLSLGAVDDHVLNPIGFDRDQRGTAVPLEDGGAALTVSPSAGRPAIELDGDRGVSEVDVAALRGLPGLRLHWRGARGPQGYCRVVAALAAAGVPLVTEQAPDWARHLLTPRLVDALESPVDLADRLAREEHSVLLRRAALRTHSTASWRRALAEEHGLQSTPAPRISVLLVTRRPEMVPFALRQVGRQRGVEFELVLATHGFEADPAAVDAFGESCGVPVTTFAAESSAVFGQVLNQAAARASGDLIAKMDDDDWYGPDFLSDLLLAHGYSGAEIVGCPPEFTFVEPLWLTTRRRGPTETYGSFVAGGTLLIDRKALRAVGGFRHTVRSVDATLLSAVTSAGGSVYRAQGLGYVLRRGSKGHTWDPGLGYFVTRNLAPEQWRGFRPSCLLAPSPVDLPSRSGMTECAHEPSTPTTGQQERLGHPRGT